MAVVALCLPNSKMKFGFECTHERKCKLFSIADHGVHNMSNTDIIMNNASRMEWTVRV